MNAGVRVKGGDYANPGSSAIRALRSVGAAERCAEGHSVQFYETADFLCGAVTDFLGDGLAAGQCAVTVATPDRRAAVEQRLRECGFDVDTLQRQGRYVPLDAEETLERISKGGELDADLFRTVIGGVLQSTATLTSGAPARVYGEMVEVLWRRGDRKRAVQLEGFWNDLASARAFSLLCAYLTANFEEEVDMRRVCEAHSHVLSPEAESSGAGPADALASAPETQHLRALAAEIAKRSKVEKTLRDSIRDLRKAEDELGQSQRESDRFSKIVAALADAVTPDQVFEAVVDQIASALNASSAALWATAEDDESTAHLVRAVGYPETARDKFASIRLETKTPFPALDAFRGGAPIFIDSQGELLSRYPNLATVVERHRSYRVACLPVRSQGKALGVLGFTFDDAPPIDEDERRFLMVVARYSGQALERLRLVQENQHARTRAELLYRLAASVMQADRNGEVYQAALDAIERALGTTRSAVLVFDAEGVMRFKASSGLSDTYRKAVEGHCPWSRDARSPEPIIVSDVGADPSLAPFGTVFENEGIRALAFIPLVASGRLIGKFMVYYPEPRVLGRQELEVAGAIANHVAAAIARFAAVGELQETVRFNEMFTAILGHDLRNPLGAIMTAAQLVMRRADNERLMKPLGRILSSGERMARMIDQLLDFTRLRVGAGIPLQPKPLDLVPLLRQILDELDDANPDWKLQLERSGDTFGVWDEDRLGQVFSNLVGNALQYGVPEFGVRVRVDGTAPGSVSVEVHNMGAVPPALIANLFEPMTGGDRRREKSHGLGLGLFISRQIARAHGGAIEVESSETDGTRFRVTLPRTAAQRREPHPG